MCKLSENGTVILKRCAWSTVYECAVQCALVLLSIAKINKRNGDLFYDYCYYHVSYKSLRRRSMTINQRIFFF